ncbi:MAG: hypothetical protein LUH05_02045 [Candidatus Gastranaerophilales bacterium]|nr:hypothetical protein [Candidatus Gastranaerophilales bacterium]
MENINKIRNIIKALGEHQDSQAAIALLTELGTNSPDDEIRELTAQTLIKKNTHESLRVVLISKGKGINDLSARVAMASINELLTLKDKTEAIKILDDTIKMHSDEEVRNTARSVRALMTFS